MIKRQILWLSFLLATPALAQTNLQGTPKSDVAPGIIFDSQVFNFGRIKSGEVAKHDFFFTNRGHATLEITEVKPGCGCTTAGEWDKKVGPGGTGRIPLQFNSTGFGGQIGKSAFVTCNDPAQSNVILQVTGTVWKPIDVTPAMATFTPLSESPTNETRVLRIVSNLEEPITLSDVQCGSPSFKAQVKEVKPGKEFELHVTTVPPFASPTAFAPITIKTSSTNAPIVNVSAYAMVQQAIMLTPQQVTLPSGPLKAPFVTAVLARNNSTNAFSISDVHVESAGVELKLNEMQPGRLYSIAITFPVGFEIQPGLKPEITFKSTHPGYPLLRVPLVQATQSTVAPNSPRIATSGSTGSAGLARLQPASPTTRPAIP